MFFTISKFTKRENHYKIKKQTKRKKNKNIQQRLNSPYITQTNIKKSYCLWSEKWFIKSFSSSEISNTGNKDFSICLFMILI